VALCSSLSWLPVGVVGHDRSGLGRFSGIDVKRFAGGPWERDRIEMMRGCFRVSPNGTDVMGLVAAREGSVARCVSVADTSLSLSLSLSVPAWLGSRAAFGARRGARHDLSAGSRRAPGRGISAAWHWRGSGRFVARVVGDRGCVGLGRPVIPRRASRGATARLYPSLSRLVLGASRLATGRDAYFFGGGLRVARGVWFQGCLGVVGCVFGVCCCGEGSGLLGWGRINHAPGGASSGRPRGEYV
jgi:hypothetical protein